MVESLGQSIANIAPTLTPAINITVVAGLAGFGSWISYLIATVGLLFVGAAIATLARRHPLSGSYFVYIGRTVGPLAGMLAGWSMICAYLFAGVAVLLGMSIFLSDFLTALGIGGAMPPSWLVTLVVAAVVLLAAYRDIQLSSRIGLVLEAVSIAIIVGIIAIVVVRHGTVLDPRAIFGPDKVWRRDVVPGVRGVQLRRVRERGDTGQGNAKSGTAPCRSPSSPASAAPGFSSP